MVNETSTSGAPSGSQSQSGSFNGYPPPQLSSFSFDDAFRRPNPYAGGMPQETHGNGQFDIIEWYPAYQSCQKYFLDHSQYHPGTMSVAAFLNIYLPHQWPSNPIRSSTDPPPTAVSQGAGEPTPGHQKISNSVSLIPYVRRLIVTGFDKDAILHGFFGEEYKKGVGPMQECERRNYLFAAKSGGWIKVKNEYDMGPHETVPFLQPPQNIQLPEIESAERQWSQWLSMEDWIVGPRAPENEHEHTGEGQNH